MNEVEYIPIRMGRTGATDRSRAIRELRTSNRQFEGMAAAEDACRLKLDTAGNYFIPINQIS